MAINVGSRLEIVNYCVCGDQAALNVLHYLVTATSAPDLSEQLVLDAYTAFQKVPYANAISGDASFQGSSLRKETAGVWGGYYYARDPALGVGDTCMPRQTTGIITWRSPVGGRSGRGRSYIPFPGESWNKAEGKPEAAYITLLTTLGNKLRVLTGLVLADANTIDMTVYIRKKSDGSVSLTDRYSVPAKFATQRRRGSYGRPNRVPDPLA